MKNQKPTAFIYRDSKSDPTEAGKPWILEWPSPQGYTLHKTRGEAEKKARASGMKPERGTDRE